METAPVTDILTTTEAARFCGVSAETIRRWIRTKGLPAYNTQLGLNIRIRRADLEAFARQHNILLPGSSVSPDAGTAPAASAASPPAPEA